METKTTGREKTFFYSEYFPKICILGFAEVLFIFSLAARYIHFNFGTFINNVIKLEGGGLVCFATKIKTLELAIH